MFPHYKVGGVVLPKYDIWVAIIQCFGMVAPTGWNTPHRRVECLGVPNVDIILGESRATETPLQTKDIMWALLSVSYWWEMRKESHYAETNFAIKLQELQIGVGQVKAKPPRPSPGDPSPRSDPRLKLRASFRDDQPPVCHPYDFYKMLMLYLIEVAEMDPSAPVLGIGRWYPGSDMTFVIGPTSEAAGREGRLPVYAVIATLVYLGQYMATAAPDERFRAFEGVINWDGPIVGKFRLQKGK